MFLLKLFLLNYLKTSQGDTDGNSFVLQIPVFGNGSKVIPQEGIKQITNGVIYIVDKVILPPRDIVITFPSILQVLNKTESVNYYFTLL